MNVSAYLSTNAWYINESEIDLLGLISKVDSEK